MHSVVQFFWSVHPLSFAHTSNGALHPAMSPHDWHSFPSPVNAAPPEENVPGPHCSQAAPAYPGLHSQEQPASEAVGWRLVHAQLTASCARGGVAAVEQGVQAAALSPDEYDPLVHAAHCAPAKPARHSQVQSACSAAGVTSAVQSHFTSCPAAGVAASTASHGVHPRILSPDEKKPPKHASHFAPPCPAAHSHEHACAVLVGSALVQLQ
eukprot:1218769-Rhodomonas_salina.1